MKNIFKEGKSFFPDLARGEGVRQTSACQIRRRKWRMKCLSARRELHSTSSDLRRENRMKWQSAELTSSADKIHFFHFPSAPRRRFFSPLEQRKHHQVYSAVLQPETRSAFPTRKHYNHQRANLASGPVRFYTRRKLR